MTEDVKHEAPGSVGCSAWLGGTEVLIVKGDTWLRDKEKGIMVSKPATLAQQLRSVESAFGAEVLKRDLKITFQAPVSC